MQVGIYQLPGSDFWVPGRFSLALGSVSCMPGRRRSRWFEVKAMQILVDISTKALDDRKVTAHWYSHFQRSDPKSSHFSSIF